MSVPSVDPIRRDPNLAKVCGDGELHHTFALLPEIEIQDGAVSPGDLVEAIDDVVIVVDRETTNVKIISATATILAGTPQEISGISLADIFPGAPLELLSNCHHRALATGQTQTCEYGTSVGDTERWFQVKCSQLTPATVLWVARDLSPQQVILRQQKLIEAQLADQHLLLAKIVDRLQTELSERHQAQQLLTQRNAELARATRLKDEFLANMSHELRTPLNAILGLTEALQEEVFGSINPKQRKHLQTVERSGTHLLELINDILDVAKIEAGQLELDCQLTNIALLCNSTMAFIKQQALTKRIQLQLILADNLPELYVDRRRIRQVSLNLLNNAVKFTQEGGKIRLEVSHHQQSIDPPQLQGITRVNIYPTSADLNRDLDSREGRVEVREYIKIAIVDTGIGIAPEHIHKLFQPFSQIDSALNRQYSGTGLGLALVKQIVELHGGQVGLTSEVGRGSCFWILLPIHCANELPSTPSQCCAPELPTSAPPNLEPDATVTAAQLTGLILLVEDNEANVMTICSYLEAKGYRLIVARSGIEAIDLTKSAHPDLILMDIQLPGMDGIEAIRSIRRDPDVVAVPIIALTALAMTGDRERCLAAGANEYLSKPIKLKQLTMTIQQFLAEQLRA